MASNGHPTDAAVEKILLRCAEAAGHRAVFGQVAISELPALHR
jgi:hypothetical protein